MKINITYNDIQSMVSESIKRILKEDYYDAQTMSGNLNLVSIIGDRLEISDDEVSAILNENSLPSSINITVTQSEGQTGMGEQDYGMVCSLDDEAQNTVQNLLGQVNNLENNEVLSAYQDILLDLDAIQDKTIEDFDAEYGQYLENVSSESNESYDVESDASQIAGLK